MKFPAWKIALYSILTMIGMLLLIEGVLRIIQFGGRVDDPRFVLNPEWDYPEYFLKDHDLFWRFRPNQTISSNFFVEGEYRINNHGLRGPDFSAEKDPGLARIICLGNSCTFGWKVAGEETYPRQLESILNGGKENGRWQVINAGVTGYSSLQGLRFLRREVLNWDPDILIISYGWNDQWAGAQDIADKEQELPAQWILDIQNTLNLTMTYRGLKYLLFTLTKPPAADFSRTDPVYRVNVADYRKNIRQMITLAYEHDIAVYLMTTPVAPIKNPSFQGVAEYHKRYNGVLREIQAQTGIPCIDVAAVISGKPAYFNHPEADLKHFNSWGHKTIARMVAQAVLSRSGSN